MATVGGHRVWFKLEGAASADRVDVPPGADVVDLRDAIQKKLTGQLQAKHGRVVDAGELRLSSADGKTNYDEEALVSTIAPAHATKATALLVTGVCRSCRALTVLAVPPAPEQPEKKQKTVTLSSST